VLEVVILRRRPTKWKWQVCNMAGTPVMSGWGRTRQAAQYHAYRALFLLLAAGSPNASRKRSVT
jgi:hypothetical protein